MTTMKKHDAETLATKAMRKGRGKIRQWIDFYPAIQKADFHVSRFLAMRGLNNPLRDSSAPQYWASRKMGDVIHSPTVYTRPDITTEVVLRNFFPVVGKDASFLEVGCNAGRNLKYLYDRGYRDLAGIDINRPAIEECLKNEFPDLYACGKFYVGSAAEQIRSIPDDRYDVVFSNAVLIHIPPKDISLFADMVRVSKRYISIFTEENALQGWPYDFQAAFESVGCKLVHYQAFYGADMTSYQLPTERYDAERHFYDTKMLRIFVKNRV